MTSSIAAAFKRADRRHKRFVFWNALTLIVFGLSVAGLIVYLLITAYSPSFNPLYAVAGTILVAVLFYVNRKVNAHFIGA